MDQTTDQVTDQTEADDGYGAVTATRPLNFTTVLQLMEVYVERYKVYQSIECELSSLEERWEHEQWAIRKRMQEQGKLVDEAQFYLQQFGFNFRNLTVLQEPLPQPDWAKDYPGVSV